MSEHGITEQKTTEREPRRPPQRGSSSGERSGFATRPPGAQQHTYAALKSEHGDTAIADLVVVKVAALAAREIPGVHDMGRGMARAVSGVRAIMPGQETISLAQGVSVEVGERQAAVDLDLVTEYGVSIVEVSEAVRRNVIERIEHMTGLEVTEVNIRIDDLYVEALDSQDSSNTSESRVE